MDDELVLSTDSFVDVFANTVGIIIILTVLTIILAGLKAPEMDAGFAVLAEQQGGFQGINQDITKLQGKFETQEAEIAKRNKRVKGRRLIRDKARAGAAKISGQVTDAQGRFNALSAELTDLKRQEAGAEQDLAAAEREVDKALRGLKDEEVDELQSKSEKDLQAMIDVLQKQADQLLQESKAFQADRDRLDLQSKELERRSRSLELEIRDLEVESKLSLAVVDPLRRRDRQARSVWVECYLPEKSLDPDGNLRPCIRLITPDNYRRDGRFLRARVEGESTVRIHDADSSFGSYLASKDAEYKATHFLYFVVRPDAYTAFLRARRIARAAGWLVRWDPLEAGEDIAIGGGLPLRRLD